MKKLNKILAVVLSVVMVMALLAGCGPKINTGTNDTGNTDTGTGSGDTGTGDTGSGDTGTGDTGTGDTGTGDTGTGDTGSGDTGTTATQVASDMYPHDGSVSLRMAVGYNNDKTAITFRASVVPEGGTITLADGQTYRAGDMKPTWAELQNVLGVKFEDKYTGKSAKEEWNYWEPQLDQIDMIFSDGSIINEAGEAGSLVNLADYLDYMPNFKAYLEANPIVRLSITANVDTGAIYFSPYFDGVNDIEKMFLMRTDWVEKLLNGEGEFTAAASNNTATPAYQPYMPTSGSITIDSANAEGTDVIQITKNYDAYGNIIEKMNAAGSMSGVDAVNMLREYIDNTYDGYYGTNRANLFIGQDACWDADELVALLRCVVANPQTLNGTDSVQGIFCREDNNLQRQIDLIKGGENLFGVRGYEGRSENYWIDSDGNLHDWRAEEDTYVMLSRLHDMATEGLISKSWLDGSEENTKSMMQNDMGFMEYDYNQTQTGNNQWLDADAGEKFSPVMVPVARWYDGTDPNGVYMRFTESWRSVKGSNCWGISKSGVAGDDNKLYACLALIDYAYTHEGTVLMSYGPDAFLKHDASGNVVNYTFNGEEWPEISDQVEADVWDNDIGGGSYTNYARYYLGSTLSFMKSQAFEFECTHEVGKIGGELLSKAIALGIIKHPLLSVNTENMWYTSMPTTLPVEPTESAQISSYTELNTKFSGSKDQENIMRDIVISGFTDSNMRDPASAAAYVGDTWKAKAAVTINQGAFERALEYYSSIAG